MLYVMPDCLFTPAISDSTMHNAVLDMYLNMLFNIFGVLIIRFCLFLKKIYYKKIIAVCFFLSEVIKLVFTVHLIDFLSMGTPFDAMICNR